MGIVNELTLLMDNAAMATFEMFKQSVGVKYRHWQKPTTNVTLETRICLLAL